MKTPTVVVRRAGGAMLAAGALALLAFVAQPAVARQEVADAPAPAVDTGQCATCHESAVHGSRGTPHASLEKSCASCHGDVAGHLKSVTEKGEPGPITSMAKAKPKEVNETCLTCHEKGHQRTFAGGVHDRRDVACTSCHSVHAFKSLRHQLKTERDAETCFTCHQQIRAKGLRTSHHPVREGKMSCGDCHDPHGSNHDKMLVAKQPFLCQRCHLNTRHPGTLYDGRNTTAVQASASNRAVEHGCRNCHQNVHGGNAPSGPYLGR